MDQGEQTQRGLLSRRAFIREGTLFLAGSTLAVAHGFAPAEGIDKPKVRVGLVADLHYADREPAGTRHYRESLAIPFGSGASEGRSRSRRSGRTLDRGGA